ncbi:MAG TPA: hypothetical protein DD723_04465 [Candidatus Omnitrophica bacterium]|nr:MAG: hypothetical protein A2Z81_03965 [Omnitrophica WOR_2 bacterium GWA2_45_18]OGX20366.1 MAG: hypothetical protein A2Y04_05020 [Omnitrophica WOR_2 bacterium GWC2_45_7]HBR14783.1 hypothetical protein [Candidatus Omnitrophota bacterium]
MNKIFFLRAAKIFTLFSWALALLPGAAHATPSTHIWAPSADVQPFKKWHITSDFYVPTENDATDTRPDTVTNLGLTVGVLPFEKLNMEVGFDHKSGTGVDDYPMYLNTKIGIPEGAYGEYFPKVAVGIYDVGTRSDKTNFNVVYGKIGKSLSWDDLSLGVISFGYFQGNSDLLLHNGKEDNDGLLACWERTMTEISDKLWVAVDYQGSKSAYGTLNLGFAYKFSDNTSVILGYDIYNNADLANTYTAQVDIDF